MSIKSDLYNLYLNANIKPTKEPTLVFQSDDWGSQRMPSIETFKSLKKENWLKVESCHYSKNDSLESVKEIEDLLNVLDSFKDKKGNSPIFTLNMNLFNPDFEKLKECNFESFHEMNLSKSYKYYGSGDVIEVLKNAQSCNFIDIQYHGKQHFNVGEYMKLVKTNEVVQKAANFGFYALSFANSNTIESPFLATYSPLFDREGLFSNFKEGFDYFSQVFNFPPTSFIAPVYAWTNDLEDYAVQMGCKTIQGLLNKTQKLNGVNITRRNNNRDRIVQVRNVSFEPSTYESYDWLSRSMKQIEIAFLLNKPAIISTHRLNYIASINPNNSGKNLILLNSLLKLVLKKWPNVNFLKTSELYV